MHLPNDPSPPATSRARLWLALIALYFAWGSTYLAIRVAIETIPPLLMAGFRFLVAGTILYAITSATGTIRPRRDHWISASIIAACLLLIGNGGVVYAEKTVPSGVTALLVGTTPIWMVLLSWLGFGGSRPSVRTVIGLVCGFAGVALLVAPFSGDRASEHVDPFGAGLILLATLSWTVGSLYSKRARLPSSPMLGSAMQMLAGGAMLFLAGLVHGEWSTLNWATISLRSGGALLYLIIIGSLVGFSAYVYVLKHANPAKASTYAYVNPVVAVVLGWAIAGEPIGLRTVIAGIAIVAAVILMSREPAQERK